MVRSSMDRTWMVVGVGGSPRVSSFEILGKRIKLALANKQLDALSLFNPLSEMRENKTKGKKIHGPTPSSPPRRNYEITPRTSSASRGRGPTIEPCSKKKRNGLVIRSQVEQLRVREVQLLILKTRILKIKESGGGEALLSRFSCSWILRNHKNP